LVLHGDLLILLGFQLELEPRFRLFQLGALSFERSDPVLQRLHGLLAAIRDGIGQMAQLDFHREQLTTDATKILVEFLDRSRCGLVRLRRETHHKFGLDVESLQEL